MDGRSINRELLMESRPIDMSEFESSLFFDLSSSKARSTLIVADKRHDS